jgi:hypothetical protein
MNRSCFSREASPFERDDPLSAKVCQSIVCPGRIFSALVQVKTALRVN